MKTSLLFISMIFCALLHGQYHGMDSVQFANGFKGLALKPSDYATNPTKRYPLIVTIGGNGEVGTQLSILFNQGVPRRVLLGKPTYQVMAPGDTARFLYVCLLPDVSTRGGQPNFVNGAIDYMVANYRVDTTKIMVSGLSQGGNDILRYGLWAPTGDPTWGSLGGFDYRQKRVRFYVSGSPPLVGSPFDGNYNRYATYSWGARFFHGALDGGLTAPSGSKMMNDSINKYHPGSSQRFLLAAYGHDSNVWDSMYSTNGVDSNINIYRWLVMSPSVVVEPPAVAVPGPPQIIAITSTVLNAAGSYSPNGPINGYQWQQVSGPAPATILSASSVTPSISNLLPGTTYSFQLTVTDITGATGSATTNVTILGVLPVHFAWFKGQHAGNDNLLQWATDNEQNNNSFFIERSSDGGHYTTIGTVLGKGNGNSQQQYSFTDPHSSSGVWYYRLRQTDNNGASNYSATILISGNSILLTEIFPNPFQDKVQLAINNSIVGEGNMVVYNLSGQVVKQERFVKNTTTWSQSFNLSNLTAGTYMLSLKIGNNYNLTQRLLKQ